MDVRFREGLVAAKVAELVRVRVNLNLNAPVEAKCFRYSHDAALPRLPAFWDRNQRLDWLRSLGHSRLQARDRAFRQAFLKHPHGHVCIQSASVNLQRHFPHRSFHVSLYPIDKSAKLKRQSPHRSLRMYSIQLKNRPLDRSTNPKRQSPHGSFRVYMNPIEESTNRRID